MATLAVVGALAVFVALGLPNANTAEAQNFVTEPGAPTISGVVAGDDQLTVYLGRPAAADIGLPPASNYQVQYIASDTMPSDTAVWLTPSANNVTLSAGETTGAPITSLANGTRYFVRAALANDVSRSASDYEIGPWSDVSGPHQPATEPGAPTGVTAATTAAAGEPALAGGAVRITWTAPTTTGGATGITIAMYELVLTNTMDSAGSTNAADLEDDQEAEVAGDVLTYDFRGLSGGSADYSVEVVAKNSSGLTGTAGTAASIVASAAKAPDMPTDLKATGGEGSLTVEWTEPYNGGRAIVSYDVQYRMPGGTFMAVTDFAPDMAGIQASGAGTTSAKIVNLSGGVTYEVQVAAVNMAATATTPAVIGPYATTEGTTMAAVIPDITTQDFTAKITSNSSTSGGSPELKVVFGPLPVGLPVGSSIVLYLEDDYQEPASIPASSVYFVAENPRNTATGNGARVYASDAPDIDTDDYFDVTKSDISIRVFIPDMCADTGASGMTNPCAGPNGPEAGQTLTMVIRNTSGIKNPSEAGKHSVAVKVIGPADAVPGPDAVAKEDELVTAAKVSLSDNNNKRGYEMTVTGSGYNDGTTATAYVLARMITAAEWWDSLDCEQMITAAGMTLSDDDAVNAASPYCKMYAGLADTEQTRVRDVLFAPALLADAPFGVNGCGAVVANGTSIGTATVGANDNADIPVTVSVPTFKPGKVNYICVSDGESLGSGADVEVFELEDSIRVVPTEVNAGDTVTLFAEDFVATSGLGFHELKLGGEVVTSHSINPIGSDGSATGTFVMPATIGGNPVKGIIRVDGRWGGATGPAAATKITVKPAGLTLTRTEALPNQSITIQGNGFSNTSEIRPAKITIDGVALMVDADSLRADVVRISNGGQFVATIYLWPESGTTNPALVTGTHTIRVEDEAGFVGTTPLTILEPSITVVPLVAGPRDIVVIRGENFPVDNLEGGAVGPVGITVKDSRDRIYSEIPDGSGRFTVEHRVSSNVAIPSVATVKATYGSEITKTGSFQVPEAIITVEPALAAPGDTLTLTVNGMPVHASVDSITIGGREALGNLNINTDRDGTVMAEGIVVPGLDPGIFSVQLEVNEIVAIGQVEVVSEGPRGLSTAVGDALAEVGDNLVVVWHFNTTSKVWTFYDPRPETAEFNTLSALVDGQAYLVLVSETQQDVVLNNETRKLTCVGGDCWNQIVW